MSKAVLISIRPHWCELIASGKKTIEIRKTCPKQCTPFKCYIYETRGKTDTAWMDEDGHIDFHGRGQVIGEFVCGEIYKIDNCLNAFRVSSKDTAFTNLVAKWSCLSFDKMKSYLGNGDGYGWHISDLVIYEKPRELAEFGMKRAPQSWCYVEEARG